MSNKCYSNLFLKLNICEQIIGAVAVFAAASNLLQYHPPTDDIDRRRIIEDWDGLETFAVGGWGRGTPLESIPPPPPYSP